MPGQTPSEGCDFRRPEVTHRGPAGWLSDLLDAIGAARQGRKWQCPAHGLVGEHSVALAVGERADGMGAWVYCHAGCDLSSVLSSLHLTRADLVNPPPIPPARHAKVWRLVRKFPPPKSAGTPSERGFRFEVEHGYGDPEFAWKVRLRHPVTGEKELSWESLNPHGQRVPGLLGRRQADFPLYRERDVRMGVAAGEVVVLVESESSADALSSIGIYATTWAGGAADPPVERIHALLGGYSNALFIPDNDGAGLRCRDRLVGAGAVQRVLLGEQGEDARDMLKRLGPQAFRSLVEGATR